jgi:hypothetical protein
MGLLDSLGKLGSNIAGGVGDFVSNPLKAVKDGLQDPATLAALAAAAGGYGLYQTGMLGGAAAGGGIAGSAVAPEFALFPAGAGVPAAGAGVGALAPAASGVGALTSAATGAAGAAGSLWSSPAFLNTLGSLGSAYLQNSAAKDASGIQAGAAQAGISEQGRQFDAVRQLLAPYVAAGNGAIGQQGALIGLGGAQQQQAAIDQLRAGPQFQSMLKQGENSILSNASATGGLRGGNTQAALAQFSPQLLSGLIDQQYSRLGGLASLGQNSAAMQGNAGMQSGNQISNLLQQQGSAQAGGSLAGGRFGGQIINGLASGYGQYLAQGGF